MKIEMLVHHPRINGSQLGPPTNNESCLLWSSPILASFHESTVGTACCSSGTLVIITKVREFWPNLSQFKKGSDWWKFSIWNRVMGSQPIRIQLGKILGENLAGKSWGKIFGEILVGKSCGKCLWEILAGNSY